MVPVASWVVAALIALGGPHSGDVGRPQVVRRLCGKLARMHTSVVKTGSYDQSGQVTKSLKKIRVTLYSRGSDTSCCTGLTPIAETTTSHWGNFEFKKMSGGPYWFVARVDGREYRMPIQHEPGKDADVPLCSDCWYEIDDSGNFTFGETITVD